MRKTLLRQQKEREKLQQSYARAQRGKQLGIYLHIPFCRSKCAYCDFYSLANCKLYREGSILEEL